MPFKSQAQRAYMYANHPKIAAAWTEKYGGGGKGLPKHVKAHQKAVHKNMRKHGAR